MRPRHAARSASSPFWAMSRILCGWVTPRPSPGPRSLFDADDRCKQAVIRRPRFGLVPEYRRARSASCSSSAAILSKNSPVCRNSLACRAKYALSRDSSPGLSAFSSRRPIPRVPHSASIMTCICWRCAVSNRPRWELRIGPDDSQIRGDPHVGRESEAGGCRCGRAGVVMRKSPAVAHAAQHLEDMPAPADVRSSPS